MKCTSRRPRAPRFAYFLTAMAAAITWAAVAAPVRAESVRLNALSETPSAEAFLFTGGVPMPEGLFHPGGALRLSDAYGANWPVQSRPLATWPDGSVRWLQVTGWTPGAASSADLTLTLDAPPGATAPQEVRVTETSTHVIVVTGPLRFALNKQGFNLFNNVRFDRNRNGSFSFDERVAVGGDLVVRHAGRDFRSSRDAGTVLTVEESGPLRATIKAEGWMRDSAGRGFCKFVARVQAFAGSPVVRVYHTFIFTGYPENNIHFEYTDLNLPANETIESVNAELNLVSAAPRQIHAADENGIGGAGNASSAVVRQLSQNSATLDINGSRARSGIHTAGWIQVQDGTFGVIAGVRDAWQQYPKGFKFTNSGTPLLSVDLWPEAAGPLDLKTTSAAYGSEALGRGSAFGLGKTHEVIFRFDGSPRTGAEAQALIEPWLQPALLAADPGWVQSTGVLGGVAGPAAQTYPNVEAMLERLFRWAERQPRDFNWYGMLDYGDTLLWWRKDAYDVSYPDWGWHPDGRWGWHNVEHVGSHTGALLGFLRTQSLDWFRFGEAKARHVMDIDTVHYNTVQGYPGLLTAMGSLGDTYSKVGSMHRHNGQEWGGRNDDSSHTHLLGLLIYYYLTGYDRAWDVAKEVGEFMLQDPATYARHPDNAQLRGLSNVLWADALMYEATRDARYKTKADAWAQVLLSGQRTDGMWLERYDPTTGAWSGAIKMNYVGGHAIPALIAYHRILGAGTLKQSVGAAIVRAVDGQIARDAYLQYLDGIAYAYELTGDARYRTEGEARLNHLVSSQVANGDPLWDGTIFSKATYDRVPPVLSTVPLMLAQLTAPQVDPGNDPGAGLLLHDEFDNGTMDGWTVVDEGTNYAPSLWSESGGELIQASNIWGGPNGGSDPVKPGTQAVYDGGAAWTDYTVRATLKSGDDDGIGLMARYRDARNTYRFSMDSSRRYRRLVKIVGGVTTTLWQDAVSYPRNAWMNVEIVLAGSTITVKLDGTQLCQVQDGALSSGTVALYSWGNDGTRFGSVAVEGEAGAPPPPSGGPQLLDSFDDGAMTGWSVVDEGTTEAPSQWSETAGKLIQRRNIWGGPNSGSDPVKPGTQAVYDAGAAWTDYTVRAAMKSSDDDGIGLMARYRDAGNTYRFSMDTSRRYRRLVKIVNGVTTTLWQDAVGYSRNTWMNVEMILAGSTITVKINGTQLCQVQDGALGSGTVALYTWGNDGADFDSVEVLP